jgi:hypothetical protein
MDLNICADCGGFTVADLAVLCGAVITGFGTGATAGLLAAQMGRLAKRLFIVVGLVASAALMFVLYLYPSAPAALLPLAFIGGEAFVARRYWHEA